MVLFLGLTGTLGSGKDTFVSICKNLLSVCHFALSDEVRAEADERKMPQIRETWRMLGNEIREKFGPGELARRAAKRILEISKKEKFDLIMITSIRTVGEINVLRKNMAGLFLIAIDAPIKMRFERILERQRGGEENLSFEEFKATEEKELNSKDENSQNLSACIRASDFKLVNDSSEADFEKKILKLMTALNSRAAAAKKKL